MKTILDLTREFIITVDDVDSEGNITMSYKYSALKMKSDSYGINFTFNSDEFHPENPMARVFNSMIGNGFTVKMTKYGKIIEISDMDKFFDSVINSINDGSDLNGEDVKNQIRQSLQGNFGKKAIKYLLQQQAYVYSKRNIKAGDTWELNYDVNLNPKIPINNVKTVSRLDKVEEDTAYLSIQGEFETDCTKTININGMDVKEDLKGTVEGTDKVDKDNGFLCNGEFNQVIEGKMILPREGNMEMPMKSITKITYSTVKQ